MKNLVVLGFVYVCNMPPKRRFCCPNAENAHKRYLEDREWPRLETGEDPRIKNLEIGLQIMKEKFEEMESDMQAKIEDLQSKLDDLEEEAEEKRKNTKEKLKEDIDDVKRDMGHIAVDVDHLDARVACIERNMF